MTNQLALMLLYVLLGGIFLSSVIIKFKREVVPFLLIPTAVFFCVFYVIVSDQLAQDRSQYFEWYKKAKYILSYDETNDYLFTLILNGFPEGMSKEGFTALLALLMFALLCILLFRLEKCGILNFKNIPLVSLALVSDRLFLDLTLNTSRSTMSLIVFLIALTFKIRILVIILLGLAFGLHSRIWSLMMLSLVLTILTPKKTALFNRLVTVGIMLFFAKLFADFTFFQDVFFLDQLFLAEEISSESVHRGLSRQGTLTPNLAAQILMALIIPWVLLWLENRKKLISNPDHFKHLNVCRGGYFQNYALITLATCLIIYPDLTLIARLFPIPMILLLVQVSSFDLKIYTAIKLLVFFFLLPNLI